MKQISAHATAELIIRVTEEMTVRFDELGPVHPVYATYWLAKHMEEVGRKLLLSHLEPGEEGIGSLVETTHLRPALVGMEVTVRATFDPDNSDGRRVATRCEAWNELGDLIGHGRTEQRVLAAQTIEERFAELQQRWRQALEHHGS